MWGTLMSQRVLHPPPQAVPSFHMEGGLGSCKLVGLFYRKKIVGDATQSPLSLKEGGPRQRWVIAAGSG